MANDTQQFIRGLVTNVTPVRPLADPWIRTVAWCGVSLPVVGVIVLVMSRFAGSAWADVERHVLLEQFAALATGATAAAAAFATTVPGARRWIVLVPLVPLALWLGDLGQGCLDEGLGAGSSRWSLMAHWGCLPVTLAVGAFPAGALVMMLRRGAPLTPRLTTVLGAVAAGGLGNVGARFVHPGDASVVVLAWHVSAVLALAMLSASVGGSLFNWRQFAARRVRGLL